MGVQLKVKGKEFESLPIVNLLRQGENNADEITIQLPKMHGDMDSVSYTHLDVYKRQKYSRGDYLEVLASFWGLSRREATPAVGVAEFTLSAVREEDIFIPKGTRVSPGEKLFFATDEDLIIRSPATSGRVGITCQQAGSIGNGYAKGKINIIVDPVAYVAQVGNVEKTQGGADVEDDESLRTRIFYAPKGYSVAGPKDSYEFWVREFSQAVEGVGVTLSLIHILVAAISCKVACSQV